MTQRQVWCFACMASLMFSMGCDDGGSTGPQDQGNATDSGNTDDLGTDSGPPMPVDVAACDRADLQIASIDTAAETITLVNPTASTITIDSSSAYQLCQGPGAYAALPAPSPVMIGPGETATFDVSGIANIDIGVADGLMALYRSSSFFTRDEMLDYTCWGTGNGMSRVDIAREVGSDNTVLWDSGGCTPLGGATTLYRVPSSNGSSASHYTTSDPMIDCTPVSADMGVPDMGPQPVTVNACDRNDLVIHSLNVTSGTLTLFNPTDAMITVDSSSPYRLCQGVGNYDPLPVVTPVNIAPGGTAAFDISSLPNISIGATDGTLALYNPSNFADPNAMLDYVCWGTGGTLPRLDVAMDFVNRSDNSVLWDGSGCIDLMGASTLYLSNAVEGNTASDYTTTDPTLVCM